MKERVIFRETYDPFMKMVKYMCIFPDDEANPGNVCYVDIWQNSGKWWHDCYDEVNINFVLKNKIIHKNDPVVDTLVEVLRDLYGSEFIVAEKMRT